MNDNNYQNPRSKNNQQQDYSQNREKKQCEEVNDFFSNLQFKVEWISIGANEEMVNFAEKAGMYMAKNGLTNSKIRSIYSEIKRIQMGVFDKERASFYLLKPKVAYALGRDSHNNGLQLFKLIFDQSSKCVSDQKTYQNFCNLIEAILAYHKAFGGKD